MADDRILGRALSALPLRPMLSAATAKLRVYQNTHAKVILGRQRPYHTPHRRSRLGARPKSPGPCSQPRRLPVHQARWDSKLIHTHIPHVKSQNEIAGNVLPGL